MVTTWKTKKEFNSIDWSRYYNKMYQAKRINGIWYYDI